MAELGVDQVLQIRLTQWRLRSAVVLPGEYLALANAAAATGAVKLREGVRTARPTMAPNPSINRTFNGLRPLAAGYVKR